MTDGNTMPVYWWRATYDNGETFTLQPGSTYNQYHNIDRTRLRVFELFNHDTGEVKVKLNFLPGQRLIWRTRHRLQVGGQDEVVHIVGKQMTVDGKNSQGIFLLFEKDGSVEFFDRYDAKHPFLQEVQLLPFEQ